MPRTAGTPSPEVTGPICRVPWPGLTPRRLGLLTQGHLCRFSVRARGIVPGPLFMGPRDRPNPPNGGPFLPSAGSRHYGSPRPSAVSRGGCPGRPTLRRRRPGLRCRAYPRGTGILTRFPFAGSVLRPRLGPANPRLTTVAEEPWPFPAEGILTPLRCYCRRDLHSERVHRTSRPGFWPAPTPAYRITPALRGCPGVSAAGLSPDQFSGPPTSAGELLRTP